MRTRGTFEDATNEYQHLCLGMNLRENGCNSHHQEHWGKFPNHRGILVGIYTHAISYNSIRSILNSS
jgi:hypothetical protein